MFDTFPTADLNSEPEFDTEAMVFLLSRLTTEELADVEDDLDFYHFSGVPTPRLGALFSEAAKHKLAA